MTETDAQRIAARVAADDSFWSARAARVTAVPTDPTATIYKLPALFTNDYAARCLDDMAGRYVRDGQRVVYIRLTPGEASDLLADARHYADTTGDYWEAGLKPLHQSAARVVAALARQGVTA